MAMLKPIKILIVSNGFHFLNNSLVTVGGSCLLKIPLLFMTTTITDDLVKYLQQFVGICIPTKLFVEWKG